MKWKINDQLYMIANESADLLMKHPALVVVKSIDPGALHPYKIKVLVGPENVAGGTYYCAESELVEYKDAKKLKEQPKPSLIKPIRPAKEVTPKKSEVTPEKVEVTPEKVEVEPKPKKEEKMNKPKEEVGKPTFLEVKAKFDAISKVEEQSAAIKNDVDIVIELANESLFRLIQDGVRWA